MLRDHPHVQAILRSISDFRSMQIDIEELQATLHAVEMAMESSMPRSLRNSVFRAVEELELIRFTVDEADQAREVEPILRYLEHEVSEL